MGVSNNKILQEYTNYTSHDVLTLLSAQSLSDSNFPEAAHNVRKRGKALLPALMELLVT